MERVVYRHRIDTWDEHKQKLVELIQNCDCKDVCDAGGGATPLLSQADIASLGIKYTILDISQEQLDKAAPYYDKICVDICDEANAPAERYDLIFSAMLAEHVADGVGFHRTCLKMLKPGGIAFHYFPTLYAPPFIANALLPEGVSNSFLWRFARRDAHLRPKFPARYDLCRGPTRRQLARLKALGFEIYEYTGFFGHNYYAKIPPLRILQRLVVAHLLRHPVPALTAFAYAILRKPLTPDSSRSPLRG